MSSGERTSIEDVAVDPVMVRESFPSHQFTFADFVDADRNLVTVEELDSDDESGTPQKEDPIVLGEEDEPNFSVVTNKEALQAITTIINHCSQREDFIPDACRTFCKYRDKVFAEYLTNKETFQL